MEKKKNEELRHQMDWSDLNNLYFLLCELLADITRDECEKYRDSIADVKHLVNQCMMKKTI